MELNGILGSLPLVGAIVGVISGTLTVLLHVFRGYRRLRERRQRVAVLPGADAPHTTPGTNLTVQPPAEPAPPIRTPDQRLRVFLSSTLQELAKERAAARQAITRLHLTPVLFELGARPHPPRDLYRAYLAQSDIFVGIYWQSYGWVAPGEDVSGLEDEYQLAGNKPKLIYFKAPAPEREPRLAALLDRIRSDDHVSYKSFRTVAELRGLVANDLALLLTERFARPEAADKPKEPAAAPPPSAHDRPAKLPIQTTSFIGRVVELAEVKRLIDSSPVVTLTGAGGVGKTRLALQVAADVQADYEHGVWLVELAPVAQPELVPHLVARVLRISEQPGQHVLDTLTVALRSRQLLLVLDNCEHLLESCARVVDTLIHACADLRVVTTSREPLGIAGESIYQVPPLQAAAPAQMLSLDSLTQLESVQLFKDRALAALPGFSLTAHNAAAVAEVCHRLDGIPLAIELAAARVKVLTPEQIASRLNDRFHLLSIGSRTAPLRQQTLRALVDWSYELLSEQEKALFRRLSVFAGGWTLEAAEVVCAGNPIEPGEVLDRLSALVDKSLVLAQEQHDGQMRYRLLETLRQYGQERLLQQAESNTIGQHHAAFFLQLVEQSERMTNWLKGAGREWLDRLDLEQDNLRAAVRWLINDGDVEGAQRFAGTARRFWFFRGYVAEGLRLLEEVLALDPAADRVLEEESDASVTFDLNSLSETEIRRLSARARVLHGIGQFATLHGDVETGQRAEQRSVRLYRLLGDKSGIAWPLQILARAAEVRRDFAEAQQLNEEALAAAQATGQPDVVSGALNSLAVLALEQGRPDEARQRAEEAFKVAQSIEFTPQICQAAALLGGLEYKAGRFDAARSIWEQALSSARETRQRMVFMVPVMMNLGRLVYEQGDIDRARSLLAEGLTLAHDLSRLELARALEVLVLILVELGQPKSALEFAGAAAALRAGLKAPLWPTEQERHDPACAAARQSLSAAAADAAWMDGSTRSVEQTLALALDWLRQLPAEARSRHATLVVQG